MDELLDVISDLVSNTPPERIVQLAEKVRGVSNPSVTSSLNSWALTPDAMVRLNRLTTLWRISAIPGNELAGMLLGASHAYWQAKLESHIELVWTGPSSELIATRKTEQALLEVINTAREKLFLTSFVAYDIDSIMAALSKAADRHIDLSILLESSDKYGGGVSIDGIARMRDRLPSAKVYFWEDKDEEFAGGKVHAKVAVCDEELCFISSANLTGHAMEKNMEAGVLIRGGTLPKKLHNHLEALVTVKILKT